MDVLAVVGRVVFVVVVVVVLLRYVAAESSKNVSCLTELVIQTGR